MKCASIPKFSATTCIIGLFITSISGFGKVYPADANLITIEEHASFDTDVTLNNTSIAGNDINLSSIDATSATSFTISGGTYKYQTVL